MKKKIQILSTLGPSSLNKDFLRFAEHKVSLLRLNLSHLSLSKLIKNIKFLKKNTNIPICIDTEGAQIRTKTNKKIYLKKNKFIKLYKKQFFYFYPEDVYSKLKINDMLDVGFNGLKLLIKSQSKDHFNCIVVNAGLLENNKGVHIVNRKIYLNYITQKDKKAIEIGKKYKINHYALSFTNSSEDIKKFDKLLPNKNKIFKIETSRAIKNIEKIIKAGDNFLIDRGDLSKDIKIEKLPILQRKIIKLGNKFNKTVYVATNFLENMINLPYPNKGEINDIYSSLEMGAKGLVLAAETAIGKYPKDCVGLLKKIITEYKKND